ncbi:MAG: recombinase family protein [Candidatus Sericytochromatia bacterium]|nr:recombinase family protein [Candidatus Sericytochromatia bacterium]
MSRAVIYARLGATRKERHAIDNQLVVCRAFCQRWGMTVVAEYFDEGFSGRYADRPAFSSLIEAALEDDPEFTVIVTMDRSRFIDDTGFCTTCEDLLRGNGVTLKPVSDGIVHIPSEDDVDLPYDRQHSSHLRQKWVNPEAQRLVG